MIRLILRQTSQRILCYVGIHREWKIIAPLKVVLPDDSISVSWAGLECKHCGARRYSSQLKAGESIHLDLTDLVSGVEWYDE